MSIHLESGIPLFFVYDVPTAVAFYRDILGFEIVNISKPFSEAKDDFGWCLMRSGLVELMLNNAYENNIRPTEADASHLAAHRDTAIYFGCRDVDGAYTYLHSLGITAREPKVSYYGMKQLYVNDPDGYTLCFQWPAAPESK